MHWQQLHTHLFIDAGVPIAPLSSASQHHRLQVWNDIELAIVVVVMLDPWGLDPHNLTPTYQQLLKVVHWVSIKEHTHMKRALPFNLCLPVPFLPPCAPKGAKQPRHSLSKTECSAADLLCRLAK